MRFTDYLWDNIYTVRWVVIAFGWVWILLSATWAAMYLAFPEVEAWVLIHSLFEAAFGYGHLWIVKKAKAWKEDHE